MMVRGVFLFVLFVLSFPSRISAEPNGSPAAMLNAAYAEVREIVSREKGKLSDEQIGEKLRAVIAPLFDFEELTRRSLGAYWARGTVNEQRELVALLSELLARAYLHRITRGVEIIEVLDVREAVSGELATVYAEIGVDDLSVSTKALLHRTREGWKIFDVAVENIGLVNNYRNEFPAIVRREGFRGLIERLKKKKASVAPRHRALPGE